MMHFPRALALVSRAVWRLPARSRLRRALIRRAVISGWEATNRGDYICVGVDRLLTLGRMNGKGLMSGAAVDTDWGALFTTFDGLVIREQIFLDRDEALEAVGLKRVLAGERIHG